MGYTPENNPYIPGDPYSYDLKWIVEKLKEAIALYQPLNDKFDNLYDYVHDYFQGADFEALVNAGLQTMADDGTLATLIQPLFDVYEETINNEIIDIRALIDQEVNNVTTRLANQDADITVLVARMDTFASLPPGSTSGNAELLDIRVGVDGTTYTSAGDAVRGQITDLETAISAIPIFNDNFYPVTTPSAFKWQGHPLVNKIFTNGNGYFEAKDFDVSTYKNNSALLAKYYVDPVNGSDSNNGLSRANAFQNISHAMSRSDVGTIYLCGGIYQRGNAFFGTPITKSIDFIGIDDGVYLTTGSWTSMTLMGGYSYTYRGSRSNSPSFVIDITAINEYGDPTKYTNVNSIADVESTPGSWYHNSGYLYMHTLDGSIPDSTKIIICSSAGNASVQGNISVYFENCTFIGGTTGTIEAVSTAANDDTYLYAKDCKFLYTDNINADAVMCKGTRLTIFQNCIAAYSQKDGFNYHALNGIAPNAIEINCIGRNNGNIEDSNDQGSTIHDAGNIIRINGIYYENYGQGTGDDSTNTHAWNLGCRAFASKAETDDTQNSNFFAYNDVYLWLDGCTGYGSNYNVAGDLTHTYIRNPRFTGTLKPAAATDPTYY